MMNYYSSQFGNNKNAIKDNIKHFEYKYITIPVIVMILCIQ